MSLDKKKFEFCFQLYIGLIASLGVISSTLILPCFPVMGVDLGIGDQIGVWVMTTFLVGAALGQFCWGPLSDNYGRRLPLYWGLSVLLIASIGGFFAETALQIGIVRFFQGMGAASGNTIARAICRDRYQGTSFEKIIALMFTVIPLASGVSPFMGGIFQNLFGWRFCFLFLFSIVFILILATAFLLKSLPKLYQKISFRKIGEEYRLILSGSQNIWILLCVIGIFICHFSFLTAFPCLVQQFFDLSSWVVSVLFVGFALGTFLGGFYQLNWGRKKPIEENLSTCWKIIFLSIGGNLLFNFINGDSLVVYLILMMFVGGCTAIVNSVSCAFLLRRNSPEIAGALSSLIGVSQTVASAIGSFFASWVTTPLLSILLISLGVFLCFFSYRQIQWNKKEVFFEGEVVVSP